MALRTMNTSCLNFHDQLFYNKIDMALCLKWILSKNIFIAHELIRKIRKIERVEWNQLSNKFQKKKTLMTLIVSPSKVEYIEDDVY